MTFCHISFILSTPISMRSDLQHQHLSHEWLQEQQHDPLLEEQYLRSKRSHDDSVQDEDQNDFVGLTRLPTSSSKNERHENFRSTSLPLSLTTNSATTASTTLPISSSKPNDRLVVVMMINDQDNLMKKPTNKKKSSIDDDDEEEAGNNRMTVLLNRMPSSSSTSSLSTTPSLPSSSEEHDHHRRTTRSRGSSAIDDDDDELSRRVVHERESFSLSSRRLPQSSSGLTSPANFFRRQRQQTSTSLLPTPPPFESQLFTSHSRDHRFPSNRFDSIPNSGLRSDHFANSRHRVDQLSNSRHRQDQSSRLQNERHPDAPEDETDRRRSTIERDRLPVLMKDGNLPMSPWERKHTTKKSVTWIARLNSMLNPLSVFRAFSWWDGFGYIGCRSSILCLDLLLQFASLQVFFGVGFIFVHDFAFRMPFVVSKIYFTWKDFCDICVDLYCWYWLEDFVRVFCMLTALAKNVFLCTIQGLWSKLPALPSGSSCVTILLVLNLLETWMMKLTARKWLPTDWLKESVPF